MKRIADLSGKFAVLGRTLFVRGMTASSSDIPPSHPRFSRGRPSDSTGGVRVKNSIIHLTMMAFVLSASSAFAEGIFDEFNEFPATNRWAEPTVSRPAGEGTPTPTPEEMADAKARLTQGLCEQMVTHFQTQYTDGSQPLELAYDACQKEGSKQQALFQKKGKALIETLTSETDPAGITKACESLKKHNKDHATLVTKTTESCQRAFLAAAKEYEKAINNLEACRAVNVTARFLSDSYTINKQKCEQAAVGSKAEAEKQLKVAAANEVEASKCKQNTCSAEDCAKPEETTANREKKESENDEKPTSTASEKTKSSSSGSDLMKVAGPLLGAALPAMMGLMNQQAAMTATPTAMPAVGELPADSCLRPDRVSAPECRCFITGDCRNGEVAAVQTLGSLSTGGANMEVPTSENLNLGDALPPLPPAPFPQNGGGGAPMMMGGGGGGMIGGGGGMARPSEQGGGRPRSSLSADILQGVRGGNTPMGGFGSRGGFGLPGFGGDDAKPSLAARPAQPDLKEFMPKSVTSVPVRAVATSGGNGVKNNIMHPASADLFGEVSRQYRAQDDTFMP